MAFRGCRYVLADRHPNRCRTLRKYPRIITYHSISMPYGPNLTHKFAIPQVCLYHVYVPTVHSCPNGLYNIHGDTHATNRVIRTRAVSFEWRYVQYDSITYHTNYITYPPVPSVQKVLLEPEQSEKMPFGYKSRRISHSSPHFLITMKNSIHVDQRNRNDCSRHGASSMCSSSP